MNLINLIGQSWIFWLDFVLAVLPFVLLNLLIYRVIKRKFYIFFFAAVSASILVVYLLNGFSFLTISLLMFFLVIIVVFLFTNIAELRPLINNSFARKVTVEKKEKRYDKELVYQSIVDTVSYLSKTKTGGIISIERKSSLSEFTKNGTPLNAPLSSELLMTIFYPGTRLHDGAVIIRDNIVLAASVYFPPTTKPLTGKYGSRHRAAIGISEVSDAVTIVVSEETGRISFAYGGELEPVFIDKFRQLLVHYMESTSTTSGNLY
jgi:diadenylate cyclase